MGKGAMQVSGLLHPQYMHCLSLNCKSGVCRVSSEEEILVSGQGKVGCWITSTYVCIMATFTYYWKKSEGVKRDRARAPPVIQYCTRSGQEWLCMGIAHLLEGRMDIRRHKPVLEKGGVNVDTRSLSEKGRGNNKYYKKVYHCRNVKRWIEKRKFYKENTHLALERG